MKDYLPATLILIVLTTMAPATWAKKATDPYTVSCADFLKFDNNQQEDIVYSLREEKNSNEGIKAESVNIEKINSEGIANENIYLEKLGDKENGKIIELCKSDKKANLFDKLKSHQNKG